MCHCVSFFSVCVVHLTNPQILITNVILLVFSRMSAFAIFIVASFIVLLSIVYAVASPPSLTTTTSHCGFFQILLLDESHRTFFMETGKQMITGIMVKANKVKHIFMLLPTHVPLNIKTDRSNFSFL